MRNINKIVMSGAITTSILRSEWHAMRSVYTQPKVTGTHRGKTELHILTAAILCDDHELG